MALAVKQSRHNVPFWLENGSVCMRQIGSSCVLPWRLLSKIPTVSGGSRHRGSLAQLRLRFSSQSDATVGRGDPPTTELAANSLVSNGLGHTGGDGKGQVSSSGAQPPSGAIRSRAAAHPLAPELLLSGFGPDPLAAASRPGDELVPREGDRMNLKIMAIDDEPAVLQVIKLMVEPLGVEVVTLADSREAKLG